MLQDFDPKVHKPGVTLLELVRKDLKDFVSYNYAPTMDSYEEAAKTPWYYVVQVG